MNRTLTNLGKAGVAVENSLLVLLLLGMIGLSASQIVLRNFFDIGFFWTDELLRLLVLWIAVVGAVAASRTDKHISINLVENFLSERSQQWVKLLTHIFSAAICGAVTWVSIQFVLTSKAYQDLLLGGVPAWWLQLILPVGFGLICYRYVLFLINDALQLMKSRNEVSSE